MAEPESTAVRVALWRAMHIEVDPPPHVLEDRVGLELVAPDADWRSRGDMDPEGTRPFRVGIVSRARFVEDLVAEEATKGVRQYVVLGAGLDTFAQRRGDHASRLHVFEIDQPGPQAWKRERLVALGYGVPDWLRFVPVDFEAGASWWVELIAAGFDPGRPAVVACTGVSMYLTKDAVAEMLCRIAGLAAGSTVVMTFMVPIDMLDEADRSGVQMAADGARRSGTPWLSFYTPSEMLDVARQAGFGKVTYLSAGEVSDRYFGGRVEGLRSSSGEDFLVART
ncbi:MAG: class I SAM-dependent methyltransferase [Acidimicrobiales bacterium]